MAPVILGRELLFGTPAHPGRPPHRNLLRLASRLRRFVTSFQAVSWSIVTVAAADRGGSAVCAPGSALRMGSVAGSQYGFFSSTISLERLKDLIMYGPVDQGCFL